MRRSPYSTSDTLEFTRLMDLVSSSGEGDRDLAERKELEKNERYGLHRYFINHLSAFKGRPWNCSQINFTVGARRSLRKIQFHERLHLLGVCCFVLLNRYWGTVTVPGFHHERAKGDTPTIRDVNGFQSQRQNPSDCSVKNTSSV